MTPRRKETNFAPNQPVRFYKFIALTFLIITVVLFCVIIFMSSKEATITVTTTQGGEPQTIIGVMSTRIDRRIFPETQSITGDL